tara:strand:- start:141 stop:617 length:477 start_codon:yes stop_codon:yes gene_type:complete
MVDPVSISGKKGKLKDLLARAKVKLRKAKLGGNPQVIKAAELRVKELEKFGTTKKRGDALRGDILPKPKKPPITSEQDSIFDSKKGMLANIWKKKPDTDWTKDYSKMWEKTGDPEDDAWLDDPGLGYKKGGRIKKAKKRRPRGVKIALRGYGKAMKHG